LPEDRTAIKMGIVRSILSKIESERTKNTDKSKQMVENLCITVREIIERYYLINNGKQMLEIVL